VEKAPYYFWKAIYRVTFLTGKQHTLGSNSLAVLLSDGICFRMNILEGLHLPVSTHLDRLSIVLVTPHNPLNLGAAARAMSNFQFSSLRVVNPYDVAFRNARSAVGASEVLTSAVEYASVAEAVADCVLIVGTTAVRHREIQHPLRRVEYGSRLIRKQMATGRVAILFGSEKVGLSNSDLSHCHWLMRIPAYGDQISMNLGQAVAICLYELIRDGRAVLDAKPKAQRSKLATAGDVERITASLFDALQKSGYVRSNADVNIEEKVRRLVYRMNLDHDDADLWLGMLRQILWKLRRAE
jgi:TrmH family RNA methyltransferase